MTTLADVAEIAGVSTMTVSNVLAGRPGKVSETTAKRVWAAVEQIGYVPNGAARALSGHRSRLIAIVINVRSVDALRSPHDARFIGAITAELQEHGYCVLLQASTDLAATIRSLKTWSVDAACFVKTRAREVDSLRAASDIPMLFPDNYSSSPDVLTVRIDDYGGGRLAGDYLVSKGHRRVCFIGVKAQRKVGLMAERLHGFRDTFASAGLPRPAIAHNVSTARIDSGIAAAEQVLALRPLPTAAFCSSDELAAGLMHGLRRHGLAVPRDISVVGFDGFEISEVTTPPLTTIAQDVAAKAHRCAQLLLNALGDESGEITNGVLPVRLIERKTVRDLTC